MADQLEDTAPGGRDDVMPRLGIDHIEYYVGNARQAAYYYSKAFGFHITAYAGPETRVRDRASYVCEQSEARYVFTGAMGPESEIARHAHEHGDGVKDWLVDDADVATSHVHAQYCDEGREPFEYRGHAEQTDALKLGCLRPGGKDP